MDLTQARALIPGGVVIIEPHTPERDAAALRALAAWALRFSPIAAPNPPDGLLMDIAGCEHLFGGEAALLARMAHGLDRFGFRARIASGPTFGSAWALARYGRGGGRGGAICSATGDVGSCIDPLPVCGLRIEDGITAALAMVGIERIGELRRLPRAAIAQRYRSAVLVRLDQALGHRPEMIEPVRPVDPLRAARIFDGPTTQLEAVELTVRGLLDDLTGALERACSGVRRLVIHLSRADAAPIGLICDLARASRDARHLWALIRPRLERVNLGFGVEAITLTAARTDLLRHEQTACWLDGREDAGDQPDRSFGELIDVLANKLGQDSLTRPQLVESHVPERAVRCVPVTVEAARPISLVTAVTVADRPSVLFDPAEPVRVVSLTPEGWPLRVSWRGREHPITASLGPERIGPEWWRDGLIRPAQREPRDYFKAQDQQGRWLWLFRLVRSREWFVHGEWS